MTNNIYISICIYVLIGHLAMLGFYISIYILTQMNWTRASWLNVEEVLQWAVSPIIWSTAPSGVKLFYDTTLNKITRANEWWVREEIKTSNVSVPTPKLMIDMVSWWSPVNNFIQTNRYDLSANIDTGRANWPVYLWVQRDITDKDKVDWLWNKPMIFMHTKRWVYPDRWKSASWNSNNEDITHIPHMPSSIIVWSSSRWNKIQLEPLNRTWSNYWSWHSWFNGWYAWWAVPNFESERDFTATQAWNIQILKINPFNFLQWLNTATLPYRVVDATYDQRYNFYMHWKKFNWKINPHQIIKLYFTFAYIDPTDWRSVIQWEYSEPVYLYMKSQELEKPNWTDPWDRYLIDWVISHKPPR